MADTNLIPNALPTPPNISELSRLSGFSRTTVRKRLNDGWTPAYLIPVEPVETCQCLHDVTTSSAPRFQGPVRHCYSG
jgi:hypothetical protein